MLSAEALKEKLKKYLKHCNIEDIVIFGSFVKGKFRPDDVDIALLMKEKDYKVVRKISKDLHGRFHIIVVLFNELYSEPIWKTLISEGFSVKKNKFLKNVINVKAVEIFSYKIDKMSATEKTQFNRGFNSVLKDVKGVKIGAGSVIVPEEKSGEFFDFFSRWSKAKNKVFKALLI